ncbi:MAG: DUF6675 family protein [bacterium]
MLTKQVHLLVLLWLVTETGFAQERAADSLFVSVYHDEEISLLNDLPEVFPRHRPAKLLLKCQSRVPARATILQIADSLAAMQKLVGLPYYSHTEKKMKTLFEVSEVLAHPRSSKASADPLFHELPLDTTIYIRQVDNRLGTVIYRTEIKASGEQVTFCASNLVPLKKFGLQLAEVGDCILLIAIQKQGGYLDFTAWQWLRFKGGLLGAFVKEESFVNRLKAVAGFYVKTIAAK